MILTEMFWVVFVFLQVMVTQHLCQMAGRPSASSIQWLASPSPSSSSPLWCKGSWCSAHGGRSCTSTYAGACPSRWWPSSTPRCSPRWPSLASSSSPLPSSQRWRRTGTSWSPSTSASFLSAPSAWETMYLERQLIRSSGNSTKWASPVSADGYFHLELFLWRGSCSSKVSKFFLLCHYQEKLFYFDHLRSNKNILFSDVRHTAVVFLVPFVHISHKLKCFLLQRGRYCFFSLHC